MRPMGFSNLMTDFDSLFDEFFGRETEPVTRRNQPAVNIIEKENGFELAIAAPGLTREDFNVKVDKDLLTITVNKEDAPVEGETFKRREFNFGSFERRFQLPQTVDSEGIHATYNQGILTVAIPKRKEVIARTIEIA